MRVTAASLAQDIDGYLDKAQDGDIEIIRDGREVARLTVPNSAKKMKAAMALIGILPVTANIDEARSERLAAKTSPKC